MLAPFSGPWLVAPPKFIRGWEPVKSWNHRRSVGLAELLVSYCERAAEFCQDVHHEDVAYLDALVRTFQQALKATANLTGSVQKGFLARLEHVRSIGRQLSNGIGEDMDLLLAEFDSSVHARSASWK
jgi:hypothetical protein